MAKKTKLAFYQINRGKLAVEVQELFERAQQAAIESGKAAKLTLEIIAHPPKEDQPNYMPMSYSYALKEPKVQSEKFEVISHDGVAIRDAQETLEQLKLDMK